MGKESTDVHIYLVQAESDLLCARLFCLPRSFIYDVKLKLFHQLYLKLSMSRQRAEVYRDTKGMNKEIFLERYLRSTYKCNLKPTKNSCENLRVKDKNPLISN